MGPTILTYSASMNIDEYCTRISIKRPFVIQTMKKEQGNQEEQQQQSKKTRPICTGWNGSHSGGTCVLGSAGLLTKEPLPSLPDDLIPLEPAVFTRLLIRT